MATMMGCGAWGSGLLWLSVMPVVLVVLLVGILVLALRHPLVVWEPSPPREHLLRVSYASGEISRDQYLEALVEVLKDRYVRGDIRLDEYEAAVASLLGGPSGRSTWPHRP